MHRSTVGSYGVVDLIGGGGVTFFVSKHDGGKFQDLERGPVHQRCHMQRDIWVTRTQNLITRAGFGACVFLILY